MNSNDKTLNLLLGNPMRLPNVTRRAWLGLSFAACLMLSACNTATKAVESAGENQAANELSEEEQPKSNIIRQASTVSQKGTNIRAIVNGQPITNYDVQKRVAFLKLRRTKGNLKEKALEELVEEKLRMQEARRVRVVASDSEVDQSFANFAKTNRMSPSQLNKVLSQSGVSAAHFKEFIRGQMSWPRAVGAKFRSQTQQKTTQETMFNIRQSGGEKPETSEYLLKQVVFVIPESKKKQIQARRKQEALAFRQTFTNCDDLKQQAALLLDVAVVNLPRTLEPRLPPEWKDELAELEQGGITQPKATDKGIELLAVCSKRIVSDDNAATVVNQAKEFESFNDRGDEFSKTYLAELKSKAKIVYR